MISYIFWQCVTNKNFVEFKYKDGIVLKQEGLKMTVNNVSGVTANAANELESQAKALESQKAKLFEEADEAGKAETSQEIEAKIQQLEAKQKSNLERMERLEARINELKEKATNNIVEAAKLQEKAVAEQEDKAKEVLDKCLDDYIEANKEGGKGMSQAQLSANIQKAMPESNLGAALAKYTLASQEIGQIDGLLCDLNFVIMDTESIETDIKDCNVALEAAKEAEAAVPALSFPYC